MLARLERLPVASIDMLAGFGKAMILAPHPDDESLGCGGYIAAARQDPPAVVILTDGAASHPGSQAYPPARLAALREAETADALRALGLPAEHLHFMRAADTALPAEGAAFEVIVTRLAELALAEKCRLIIGPWAEDPHCDHQAGARIAASLAARLRLPLWSYPVWGWLLDHAARVTEARAHGWRLDISPYLEVKRAAIAAHRSQNGDLITDSPTGFRLPERLLAIFERSYEVFITT